MAESEKLIHAVFESLKAVMCHGEVVTDLQVILSSYWCCKVICRLVSLDLPLKLALCRTRPLIPPRWRRRSKGRDVGPLLQWAFQREVRSHGFDSLYTFHTKPPDIHSGMTVQSPHTEAMSGDVVNALFLSSLWFHRRVNSWRSLVVPSQGKVPLELETVRPWVSV